MDKNSLSLKEGKKLSQAWYNATKNPFIIYNYFDLLEKTIHELDLQNRRRINLELWWIWVIAQTKKLQNNIGRRAKNYAGVSFYQKHLCQMIKITESNKRTPSFFFSIILLAKRRHFRNFQRFTTIYDSVHR